MSSSASVVSKNKTLESATEQLEIYKVIGQTSQNQNSMCLNPFNGDLIYTAGCFIVIY